MKDFEQRYYNVEMSLEKREDGTVRAIEGHAAVFNSLSVDLGGFKERVNPGFFDGVLENDVRAVINHDPSLILGRNKANNLKLSVDSRGLLFRIEPVGKRSYELDLIESLDRGDISQASFSFRTKEDLFTEENGQIIRELIRAEELLDVSPVTYPAYVETDVARRSLDSWKEEQKPKGLKLALLDLDLQLMSHRI